MKTTTTMKVYFSPLASSLATRISLIEASLEATFVEVDLPVKQTICGDDYRAVNPFALVPALITEQGALISENIAILLYLAERAPAALAPADPAATSQLRKWLSFVATELHIGTFSPMFDDAASDAVRAYAKQRGAPRLDAVEAHLKEQPFLLDRFTVADAYLLTVLHWAQATSIKLDRWPALAAYLARGLQRPSVQASVAVELPLYLEERRRQQQRQAAAKPQASAQEAAAN